MLALHAGFSARRLTVWAEGPTAPHTRPTRTGNHPSDPGVSAIAEVLRALDIAMADSAVRQIWLPSVRSGPLPSTPLLGEVPSHKGARLAKWRVNTIELEPAAALQLLCRCVEGQVLQPGVMIGPSLGWWAAAMRFAGSLVARQQFLPGLVHEDGSFRARWRAVWIGRDEERRHALAAAMPPVARAMEPQQSAGGLLAHFVDTLVDEMVRRPASQPSLPKATLHDAWVAALHSVDATVTGPDEELHALERSIREWRRPVAAIAGAPYRLSLRLEEPEEDGNDNWRVRFLLQARHDPSLIVPAAAVWKASPGKSPVWAHPGFQPREHLLLSLGQASGICPHIERSLKTAAPEGYELDASGAHEFLSMRAIALEEAGFGVMLPAWWTRKGTKARLRASAHVKSPFSAAGGLSLNALLQFEWQLSIGGEAITFAELKALAALKQPLVRFRGQWVQLRAEEIQAALDFWRKKGTGEITARDAVRMALGAVEQTGPLEFSGLSAEGWIADLIEQLESQAPFQEVPPPPGLQATLRPYQARGYSWLAFLRQWGLGACLADDMGLGKTIQTLSLLQRDWHAGDHRPVLLLCPTSVIGNWQKEAQRFTPELPVLIHHGAGRTREDGFGPGAGKHALVISSYALLHRDLEQLKQVPWGGIVLDEAQNIKNPGTRQATAARSLEAGYRIALTGTPVENTVGDLWSIMEFLNPGLLGRREEFKRNFYMPIQSGRDPEAVSRLKKITRPFVLRRLKTDKSVITDLPEKLEMKVFCTLTKEQASLYAAVVNEQIQAIESSEGIRRKGIVLATIARLKQVCNHPAQFLGDNSPLEGRSGKLARLTEMLEEAIAAGDRVLIFSQFTEMGDMLRRHLQETFAREALFLHGGVPKKQRDRMVERFQEEADGPPIFILSLKAGGTGLNLTRASHVFHFDRWWNPAVENQATDRAFRIGQKKNVQVHKFVCAGTLEENIEQMIEQKKEIAEGVVSAGEGWLTELSTQQLKNLFALQRSAVAD
jgi:SNF2 family DNA or RNA helicase